MTKRRFHITLLSILLISCAPQTVSLQDTHVHGLAVDRWDSSRLYIATHHGLFVLTKNNDLTLVGRSRDDFMGFSPHPTDSNILFRSGHPKGGGNLGFQTSLDMGKSWVKVSNGSPGGPADFHSLMVHPANPDHIYGWYKLRIHRSLDGGKTWEVLQRQPPEVLSFGGDPFDDNVLYIGTIGDLLISRDRGESFESMTDTFSNDVIFDIEVDRQTGNLYLATRDQGIVRASREFTGGLSFEHLGKLPKNDIPEHLALDPQNPQTGYVFSKSHMLYQSRDGGTSWERIL